MQSVAISGTQWVSTLMGITARNQWPSEVIRGHQRSSVDEYLDGHHWLRLLRKDDTPVEKGGLGVMHHHLSP
jgi:hypothetical protein